MMEKRILSINQRWDVDDCTHSSFIGHIGFRLGFPTAHISCWMPPPRFKFLYCLHQL